MSDNESMMQTPPNPKKRKARRTQRRISDSDSDYEEEVVSRKPRSHPRTSRNEHQNHPRRRLKSAHQLAILQTFFDSNTKPTKEEINELAETTALSFQEIQRWFRNERHKHKKAHGDEYEEAPPKKSPRRKRSRTAAAADSAAATHTKSSASSAATKATKRHPRHAASPQSSPPSSPHHGGGSPSHEDDHADHDQSTSSGSSSPAGMMMDSSPELNAVLLATAEATLPEDATDPDLLKPVNSLNLPLPSIQPVTIPLPLSSATPMSLSMQYSTAPLVPLPRRPAALPINFQSIAAASSSTSPSSSPDTSFDYELPLLPENDNFSPIAPCDAADILSPGSNFTWDMLADLTAGMVQKDFVDIYNYSGPSVASSVPAFSH